MPGNEASFYLGRLFDIQQGKTTDQPLLYEPDDLTTHAVVVGMTGSGKTGLCLDLLEEAALRGFPALMIDPKGDITNALLHFPDLLPQDFQPWINADQARRAGQSLEQAAEAAATSWRKGLADWGVPQERIAELKRSANFAIYTPGSEAGIPVSILASLKAPEVPWEDNREMLREKISGTVTALLGLVGMTDVDPVRSREHILLANIFEYAWSRGKDLDLGELIMQAQTPPFQKLGVFDVNAFFPEKDRFGLAMQLNNILAAPAFQTWIEGQPLDIPSLLYSPDGKPRHSVFYITHLSDAERMFFVTLLFSAVEAWMRTQGGTSSLRSLVYFDEIFGYLPPVANPPSKQPMLRMLKQARAFGVGLVLVTQNPVDVDYKALSNAGTWMIGKLQTDQDKQRLLDGLEGVADSSIDRPVFDRWISGLGKRVFLLHNVHAKAPQLFQTRWAMNFLAGPLTRVQIPALNRLAGAITGRPAAPVAAGPQAEAPANTSMEEPAVTFPAAAQPRSEQTTFSATTTRPMVPAGVVEYFLPNNLTFTQAFKAAGRSYPEEAHSQGLIYRPVLLAQATIRYLNRKYNLDSEQRLTAIVADPDRRGVVRWENCHAPTVDPDQMDRAPDPSARFSPLNAPLNDAKTMAALQRDYLDWAYRSGKVTVRSNEALKVYAGPEVGPAEFRTLCANAARQGRDAELEKVTATYDRKLEAVKEKMDREERELSADQEQYSQRKMEEFGSAAESLIGLFGGRKSSRRISSTLSKRRMTSKAKSEVQESQQAIKSYQQQIAALEKEKGQALQEISERWAETANRMDEITITPLKKDVMLDLFGIAWFPYHLVQAGGQSFELPGYGAE